MGGKIVCHHGERRGGYLCGEGRLGITAEVGCHGGERRNGCHAQLSEALMAKQREEKLTVIVEGTSYGKSQCKVVWDVTVKDGGDDVAAERGDMCF